MASLATDTIAHQHRNLVDLFERVSSLDADRPRVLTELMQQLAAHVAVESSLVSPIIRDRLVGSGGTYEQLKAYHDEIERLLILVERRKVNSPDVPAMVSEMKELTEGHVLSFRDSVLPALDSTLTADEQAGLAEQLSAAEHTVVTHPHPHLLSLGPISRLITRLAARFDEARDRTVNPQHAEIDHRRSE